jgi:transposase
MSIVETAAVTGGVKSHADTHSVAALDDDLGELLGVEEFPATPAGCQGLLDWLAGFGPVKLVGIEATDAWGRLAGHLQRAGATVVEVDSAGDEPRHGEAAALDAAAGVARAAQSGKGRQVPTGYDTLVEAIGVLLEARCSAERDRTSAIDLIRALVAAGPSDLGLRLFHRTTPALVAETAALRSCAGHPVGYATRAVLRELGQRAVWLEEQIGRLDELLIPLVAAHAAGLLATFGVDADGVLTLLAAVGWGGASRPVHRCTSWRIRPLVLATSSTSSTPQDYHQCRLHQRRSWRSIWSASPWSSKSSARSSPQAARVSSSRRWLVT